MTKTDLEEFNARVLIISADNAGVVLTARLVPSFVEIVVPESQKMAYESMLINPIRAYPDDVAVVKNWILDEFHEETIIMLRDDITDFLRITSKHSVSVKDREEVLDILMNTAIMAKGAKAHVFGFNEVRGYNPTEPFSFTGIVSSIIGVIGRRREFEDLQFVDCADYCMESMKTERVIWIDNRYLVKSVNQNPWNELNAENRAECEYLNARWGKYITKKTSNRTGKEVLQCKVTRRQKTDRGIWG